MNIKKIISIELCALTLSTSVSLPAFAAKSADSNNLQIVSKINLFNSSRLEKLDYYTWRINIESYRTGIGSIISRDLVNLYKRLDNLVVSNINIADELLAPPNTYDSNSIGPKLEELFSCLFEIDYNNHDNDYTNPIIPEKKQSKLSNTCIELAEMRAKLIIENLNNRLDQISLFNNKSKK